MRHPTARIDPKNSQEATDNLANAHAAIAQARKYVERARHAVGIPSRWSGQFARLAKDLRSSEIRVEDVNDDLCELRRSQRALATNPPRNP